MNLKKKAKLGVFMLVIGVTPPIWVDRAGVKAGLQRGFTAQSRAYVGAALQEITTRDESGQKCNQGGLPSSTGQMIPGR